MIYLLILLYNISVKSLLRECFLGFYFILQCVCTLFQLAYTVEVCEMYFALWLLGGVATGGRPENFFMFSFLYFLLVIIVGIVLLIIFITTPISAIATRKIIDQKPLTKFQKFSFIMFSFITVPLYIVIFFVMHNFSP